MSKSIVLFLKLEEVIWFQIVELLKEVGLRVGFLSNVRCPVGERVASIWYGPEVY